MESRNTLPNVSSMSRAFHVIREEKGRKKNRKGKKTEQKKEEKRTEKEEKGTEKGTEKNTKSANRKSHAQGMRVFITNVKGTFLGMSESEEASKRR